MFRILSSITYKTVESQIEQQQKGMILRQFFFIFKLVKLRNLEIGFSINLSKCL